MSWWKRLLAIEGSWAPGSDRGSLPPTLQRLASELERLAPDHARFVAAAACVLVRVADSDLELADSEQQTIEWLLRTEAGLEEHESELVTRLARELAEEHGGTDAFLVTRDLRAETTREERARLIDWAFAVAAADGRIAGAESDAALLVAEELGFSRSEALALRARWREKLGELQDWPPKRS